MVIQDMEFYCLSLEDTFSYAKFCLIICYNLLALKPKKKGPMHGLRAAGNCSCFKKSLQSLYPSK